MNNARSQMIGRLLVWPMIAGFAGICVTLCGVASGLTLPVVGEGPKFGAIYAIAIGFFYVRWLVSRFHPARSGLQVFGEATVAMLVWPLGFLGGRVLFTFFPPWDQFIGSIIGLFAASWAVKFITASEEFRRFVTIRGPEVRR